MNWKFGRYRFDDERGIVSTQIDREIIDTVLEPKASALLKYFCQHPQRDLSRDELITEVWRGQIVSDNAINRVIVQLRKALGDESKPRQFIKTVTKIGYRFITQPEQHELESLLTPSQVQSPPPYRVIFTLFLLTVPLFWILINKPFKQDANLQDANPVSIQPLSREAAWQLDADLSPDQKQLVFSVSEDTGLTLFLQNVETGEMQQVSPEKGRAHGGRWSHDGQYFVYIYRTSERCEFHKVNVDSDGLVLSNTVLQTCRLNSNTDFALSLDDEILYFVERNSFFSPYEAYALDMQEQQRWKLAQPLSTSFGNHYLDVHPETGKVLLLSEPKPGKSAVYEIDVPRNAYKKLHDFDYDLYSAVWGHQENTIVHPAEHPSYQLLKTDVNSGESTILVSDSRRISTPRRINNAQDYLFSSYIYNRDIKIAGYEGKDFNSAVMDYLPELSNTGKHLAFVSKRSGFSEIFILDTEAQQLRTLDSYDKGLTFYNLAWSHDDNKIAANTSKGVLIYDLDSGTQTTLFIEQLTYAVDWQNLEEVSYSQYIDGSWQAFIWNIVTNKTVSLKKNIAFYLTDGNTTGYITQDLRTFISDSREYAIEACGAYIMRFQLHLKFQNGRLYCPNSENPSELLVIEAGQEPQVYSSEFDGVEFFSIMYDKIATAKATGGNSDVMRTVRE